MNENYVPAGFEQTLATYLVGTSQLIDAVLGVAAVREPEKYRDCVDLVKVGRLIPQIVVRGGLLRISLIDASTGQSIGNIFEFTAPALEAHGTQQ